MPESKLPIQSLQRSEVVKAEEIIMTVTIEDMIIEGSCTAEWAMKAGYRWESLVIGGDALRKRQAWLAART